jgi:hypothetical protein
MSPHPAVSYLLSRSWSPGQLTICPHQKIYWTNQKQRRFNHRPKPGSGYSGGTKAKDLRHHQCSWRNQLRLKNAKKYNKVDRRKLGPLSRKRNLWNEKENLGAVSRRTTHRSGNCRYKWADQGRISWQLITKAVPLHHAWRLRQYMQVYDKRRSQQGYDNRSCSKGDHSRSWGGGKR